VHVEIPPPTQVLTFVFLQWAAGTIAWGAVSRLWREIQPGHFKVIWLVGAGLSLAAGFGYHPAFILAGASLVTFGAVYRRADHWAGLVTAALAIVVLAGGTDLDTTAFAGATLLGAVTNAMLLGHWHLNQPRLGTQPILRLVYALWASLAVYLTATVYLAVNGSNVAALGAWTALAFTVFAGILTAPVHHLVRTRSIMSATGILYLEILLCVVAAFTGTLGALSRTVG
jgi:hypothetical protein